jgi:phenylalanyl-tRNA synthetase beta chain
MPIINMPLELLLRLVNSKSAVIDAQRLPSVLLDVGVEVEEITSTRVFSCRRCGHVLERTEAQDPPQHCPRCGQDFRERPDMLEALGQSRVLRLNMLAVRPDLFDPGGMARCLRGFLGAQTGLVEYPLAPPRITVQVDPRLGREESFRPYIACAVLRGVRLDHERIRLLMNLQEDLHWALGRDRKLASIGVYDLDTLDADGGPFRYRAVGPDELRFVPLGWPAADPRARATPREILERHKTGQTYRHLLERFSAYPLLTDGRGTVLSMPPIINSEATRVTMQTRQCFVDVTGLSQRTVDRALNVLVTGLKEVLPDLQIEAVAIATPEGTRITPDLKPTPMKLGVREAAETLGLDLDAPRLKEWLERMGHGVPRAEGDTLEVLVPAWRNDVMHPVDLIEDAAIACGYDSISPRLVPTFTVGRPLAIEEQSAIARRVFAGLGFHQVMTLVLTSESAFTRWEMKAGDPFAEELMARAVKIENPISVEQTLCRVSLLPGLLETLALNKHHDLPQQIFEVGDCCFLDPGAETGAREERHAGAAMIGARIGYADIRAVAEALAREMGAGLDIRPGQGPGFIPGRVAALHNAAGQRIGTMGEVHPQVLEHYGLRHPVAALELSLEKLLMS